MLNAQASISPLRPDEVPAAVAIFIEAFYDSLKLTYGDPPNPAAQIDVWTFCREHEPEGFLAARDAGGALVGYAFFTRSLGGLQRAALLRGKPLVWAWRALAGRYGIVWRNAFKLLGNKLAFVGSGGKFRTAGDAQLLNIAVSSQARGVGIARQLLRAGLDYVKRCGVPEVRLEVRPDNTSAINAYVATGFAEVGRTRDAGGGWLVMTARILET